MTIDMAKLPAVLRDPSLEMTGKDVPALLEAKHAIAPGSRINVTYLGNEDLPMRVAASKAVKENGEKAGAEVVAEVQTKVSDLKAVKDADDLDKIKAATDALSQSLSKIGEAMMKEQPGQAPPEASGPTDVEANEK